MCNSIVFIAWGANCGKSAHEGEIKVVRCVIKYVISKNIMKIIFWTWGGALGEGSHKNVTFVNNSDLLPRIDKLKLNCKKYDYL